MDHIIGHVVRRGMDAHAEWRSSTVPTPDGGPALKMEIPIWGGALIVGTIIIFAVSMTLIEYTYGRLIATLLMIESPTAVLFEPLPNDDPDAPIDDKKNIEPELLIIKQQPITAKFRTTLRHLRERAGVWSRFRAIVLFLMYKATLGRLTIFLRNVYIPMGVDAVVAAVILARIQTGWTHIAISDPSPKYWFRRLPSYKVWSKVVIPTAILAAAQQVTFLLPAALACNLGISKAAGPGELAKMTNAERNMYVVKGLSVVLVAIFCAVSIVIPASVSLTRVQASLLPEEEETIVPFDRSFGGRVVPAIVGGSGVIGILDAWKTFDWNSRVRLLKLYTKVTVMQFSVAILFSFALIMQLRMVLGDDMQKYMDAKYAQAN